MLGLALSFHAAAAAINTRAAACAAPLWRVRAGLARGMVVAGGLRAGHPRSCFFGGPLAEAGQLAQACQPGRTLVQRSISRAEGASAFSFARFSPAGTMAAAAASASGKRMAAAVLVGRRRSALDAVLDCAYGPKKHL